MTDIYEYDVEIDENSPRFEQPEKILVQLKAHQLAGVYKAVYMEKNGVIHYNVKNGMCSTYTQYSNKNLKNQVKCHTNIGVLGDMVGYGKTLTALSIIASSNDIHINRDMTVSYSNNRNYSYISYSTVNENIISDIIQSTLVVVPRGPVYMQWLNAIEKHTKLKCLAIDNLNYIKKHLPEYKNDNVQEIVDFFNAYDIVLIKNTTLTVLFDYYHMTYDNRTSSHYPFIKRWKRIMIDEAHDICNKIPGMYYEFLWLISGTYENLLYSSRCYNNILYFMRDAINYETMNMILVKCAKEFVKNSFRIPAPNEKYYLCKMPAQIGVIRNFISATILEKINANDINGAIRDLGGKSETEDTVIQLVSREIKREIVNKEKEKDYVLSLDMPEEQKVAKIKNIELDIANKKMKLDDLTQRVSELDKKTCAICMCLIEHPIVLQCTHSYCASCIMRWIASSMNCPECRHKIDGDKMIAIVNEKKKNSPQKQAVSKVDTLLQIIKQNPRGKYLVFSKYDSGFNEIMNMLNVNHIACSELKGNTAHMMNVLEKFKSGSIQVILLNTYFAGSGIDISYATDVILFHSMGMAKYQAIGRAQRVGRTEKLNIHYLCYEHEMESAKADVINDSAVQDVQEVQEEQEEQEVQETNEIISSVR
jgi:SNF2 family DNA or RNA helicase